MNRRAVGGWRLHAAMLAGVALCVTATWLEWTRARAGHEVAWIYCFEWPLFGVLGVYVWWKLLTDSATTAPRRPAASEPTPSDDPQLQAWQDYLERLHAVDPPGGPPRP